MEKPNCYECKFRGEVAGSAHSQCHHPSIGEINPMSQLFAMLSPKRMTLGPMKNEINVVGDEHGIRMGWFAWPLNFDPTWLKSCDGFTPRSAAAAMPVEEKDAKPEADAAKPVAERP